MRRIRTIKPELLEDERAASLSHEAFRVFVSLILLADDYGNLRGNAAWLEAQVFWATTGNAEKALAELVKTQIVERYTVSGQSYLHIRTWAKHQKVDHPSKPGVPGPEVADAPTGSRESRETLDGITETLASDRDRDRDREGTGKGEEKRAASPSVSQPADALVVVSPVAISFPVVGTKKGEEREEGVTEDEVSEWCASYPAVDVPQALRSMRAWCLANPTKRKTKRGLRPFIVRWLGKDQDGGGSRAPPGRPGTRGLGNRKDEETQAVLNDIAAMNARASHG